MTEHKEPTSETRLEQTPYLIGWLARLEEQCRKALLSGQMTEHDFAAQEEELMTVQSAQLRLGVRNEKGRADARSSGRRRPAKKETK